MQQVETAVIAPACCHLCGLADGPYIDAEQEFDLGVFHPLNGRIYFCVNCVGRIMQAADCVHVSAIHEFIAAAQQVEAERDELAWRLDNVLGAIQVGAAVEVPQPKLEVKDEVGVLRESKLQDIN